MDIFKKINEYSRSLKEERDHDHLTGLFNKGKFMAMKRSRFRTLSSIAVFNLDVNNLKYMNDNFGHEAGDKLIKKAAESLHRVSARNVMCFRMGGDEFAVFLQNCDFKNREALIRRFADEQDSIYESASDIWEEVHVAFGIAVYEPGVDDSIEDAMRRADKIMYENKRLMKEKAEA